MGAPALRSAVYTGHLVHHRRTPVERLFRYRVFLWWIDLDEVEAIGARLAAGRLRPLFGSARRRLFALRTGDHVGDPGRSIRENVVAVLRDGGVAAPVERVMLLTSARQLGYVFNRRVNYASINSHSDLPSTLMARVGFHF